MVSFAGPDTNSIPLGGIVDTGSGVSIMSFSAFNRVALQTVAALQPHRIDLYMANRKTIKTFGIAERVRFQLGGYDLETNSLVVCDALGMADFLLGRNFLRAFRNVMIKFASPNQLLKNKIFVEDTIATVGETGLFYVFVGNLTSKAKKVKCSTMLDTAAPVRLIYHAVPQCARAHKDGNDQKSKSPHHFVNRVYSEIQSK